MTGARDVAGACAAGEASLFSPQRLSAFVDGDLPAAELQVVRQHLEGCASCARRAAELGALARMARGLEAPEPPPTLWPAIEGALERQGGPTWWLSWRPFGVGALAGAAVAALVAFGWHAREPAPGAASVAGLGVVDAARGPSDPLLAEAEAEFARAAAVYEHSIEKLRGLLARQESRWSPDVRARYAERLARLDEAIVRSREAAHRSPADSAGNEQLFAAYQQKITFLAATVHRGGGWGQGGP
jgi:hypothetical protein